MKAKISMVCLGCAKNRVDGEMLLYTLKDSGFEIVSQPEDADVVIVNTCGFIESAKKESIDEIIELGYLKQEEKIKAIIVTGCLAERYKDEILKEMPEADAVVGIGSNANIAEVVNEVLEKHRISRYDDKEKLPLCGGRIQSTPYYYSYLKIAEGCDNRCAYCAIPLIRGGFRSRPMDDIISEAQTLAKNGVKELIVIAQDTTRYGTDIGGKPMLSQLLRGLCKIDGIRWIRLLYCYPDRIDDELLQTIASEDKILKYIDLPLQHCSKNVLRAMNRNGDRESISALIRHIREMIPGVVLRTTLITGFPGESEDDFEQLSEFVNEMKFERLGCFAYSREEDTPAYDMPNQIDEEIKQHRCDLIMQQQQLIMERYNDKLVGTSAVVLCEGYDRVAECYVGRTAADSPDVDGNIFFYSEKSPEPGDFVTVKIDEYIGCDPIGTQV